MDSVSLVERGTDGRRLSRAVFRAAGFGSLVVCVLLAGCGHFRARSEDQYVYVIAKQSYLRDRLAAVSNRSGEVTNGERLVVLERARDGRFVRVRTPDGAVGWLDARATADQSIADQFEAMRKAHLHDPIVATATAKDDVYMHLLPGRRETDRFFRLAEGDTVSLLKRATVPKPLPPGTAIAEAPAAPAATQGKSTGGAQAAGAKAADEPVMEDYWLVRGPKGQTGWVYSRLIDVNVPDALARYAEGQRIVGAYVLANADDPDSGVLNNGQPVTSIPEYVTVVGPWKAGLPYDYDQVRVFIWNVKKHRYETSLRERNIAGYLPVTLGTHKDPTLKGPDAMIRFPSFSYRVLAAEAPMPAPDPTTGLITPAKTITKTYLLEGNLCRRLLAPGEVAPEEAHPVAEPEKKEAKKGRRKR